VKRSKRGGKVRPFYYINSKKSKKYKKNSDQKKCFQPNIYKDYGTWWFCHPSLVLKGLGQKKVDEIVYD